MSDPAFPLPPDLDLVAWPKYPEHWDKIENWAQCNNVAWRRVSIMARHHGLSEAERLQLLAYTLLKLQIEGMNDAYEKALHAPIFVAMPKDAKVQPDGSVHFGGEDRSDPDATIDTRNCLDGSERKGLRKGISDE